jgi:DNA-binding transcriptional LysR family regulator
MRFSYTCRMELRHLRYFVTAAEELNISRASARLRVSQPAVSRQIHDLEEELGVSLFVRGKSGLSLTNAGATFLAHARDILRRSSEAAGLMHSFRERPVKKLAIGYITPVLACLLTPALRKFEQQNGDAKVTLKELSPGAQIKALRDGSIDLALPGNPCPELANEFAVERLQRLPFQAVLPDNHLLAGRKRIGLRELKDETFIGYDEDYFPGRNLTICGACQDAGFTPRLRHRVESLSAMLATVAAGKGVTLAPAELGRLPHPGAVIIPLKPPVPWIDSAAVFRKGEANATLHELLGLCKASG